MDPSVPNAAASLLNFISTYEAPNGYDTIFNNGQRFLEKHLTAMTVADVLQAQPSWSKRFGSSAVGRYQFISKTLAGLQSELGIDGQQLFSADLQDRFAYRLLLRRGINQFIAGKMSLEMFALSLAKEWASLPVLRPTTRGTININRGQSYYAGTSSNRALVSPERFDQILRESHAIAANDIRPVVKQEDPSTDRPSLTQAGEFAMGTDLNAKPWYLSKGVIGGLIAAILPIASLFIPALSAINPAVATDWTTRILAIAAPVIGGLLAVWGRVSATQPIRGTAAERQSETFLPSPSGDLGSLAPLLRDLLAQRT